MPLAAATTYPALKKSGCREKIGRLTKTSSAIVSATKIPRVVQRKGRASRGASK